MPLNKRPNGSTAETLLLGEILANQRDTTSRLNKLVDDMSLGFSKLAPMTHVDELATRIEKLEGNRLPAWFLTAAMTAATVIAAVAAYRSSMPH